MVDTTKTTLPTRLVHKFLNDENLAFYDFTALRDALGFDTEDLDIPRNGAQSMLHVMFNAARSAMCHEYGHLQRLDLEQALEQYGENYMLRPEFQRNFLDCIWDAVGSELEARDGAQMDLA